MYADDTKIWRYMESYDDHLTLQKDINYLLDWSIRNKMKFNLAKSKVLMVSRFIPPLIDVLPGVQFMYTMGNTILDKGLQSDAEQFLSTLPLILSGPIAFLGLILLSKLSTRDSLKFMRY